jgi:ssDNA-binding Zn-finger/Zn-ribbon topoisomerase 1
MELVSESDLFEIINFYGLKCPVCNSENLTTTVNKQKKDVEVRCSSCSENWVGKRKLYEETGPRLAEVLTVTKNKGQWEPRWDMLDKRADSTFKLLKKAPSRPKKKKKTIVSKKASVPNCPKCGSPMRLIKPKRGQPWKAFWGCTKYRSTGCRGSIEA